jgi:hypothetical protein
VDTVSTDCVRYYVAARQTKEAVAQHNSTDSSADEPKKQTIDERRFQRAKPIHDGGRSADEGSQLTTVSVRARLFPGATLFLFFFNYPWPRRWGTAFIKDGIAKGIFAPKGIWRPGL